MRSRAETLRRSGHHLPSRALSGKIPHLEIKVVQLPCKALENADLRFRIRGRRFDSDKIGKELDKVRTQVLDARQNLLRKTLVESRFLCRRFQNLSPEIRPIPQTPLLTEAAAHSKECRLEKVEVRVPGNSPHSSSRKRMQRPFRIPNSHSNIRSARRLTNSRPNRIRRPMSLGIDQLHVGKIRAISPCVSGQKG